MDDKEFIAALVAILVGIVGFLIGIVEVRSYFRQYTNERLLAVVEDDTMPSREKKDIEEIILDFQNKINGGH